MMVLWEHGGMTICYFTASGNSLYVARKIGGTLLSIPQLMRQDEIVIEEVDNFLPYFNMQKQIGTLPEKNVEGQLEAICADISARKTVSVRIKPVTKAQMVMYRRRLADK